MSGMTRPNGMFRVLLVKMNAASCVFLASGTVASWLPHAEYVVSRGFECAAFTMAIVRFGA
jgi:hypothetical protein